MAKMEDLIDDESLSSLVDDALTDEDGMRLAELEPFFPEGLTTVIPFETTPFVRAAIEEVLKILFTSTFTWIVFGRLIFYTPGLK